MTSTARSRRSVGAKARRGAAVTLASAGLAAVAACGTGTGAGDAVGGDAGGRTGSAGTETPTIQTVLLAAAVRAAGEHTADTSVDCRKVKCVALTFDDGPGEYTDEVLSHLAAYRARATFFVVGQNVAANPGVVRRTAKAGHEIGNHSWSHRNLTTLSAAGLRADLNRTSQAIKAATGTAPKVMRPPYGAFNDTVRRNSPLPVVLWSVDTEDWRYRDSARVVRKAKSVGPGGVILFHDIHPTTVKAIPQVLEALSARGYRFVTVSQLFGGKPPKVVYSGGPAAAAAL
ncbi:polysaccharide deacetylase family protein [Planobispora rosea]|uniref:polysaccharide deacetylase family protein n=1 Tax=Planobispora rosea TaxID=35762 RepID=UPI00166FA246|nr:polysaccharide deacetylase family protein [Planobispora rosea]